MTEAVAAAVRQSSILDCSRRGVLLAHPFDVNMSRYDDVFNWHPNITTPEIL